MSAVLADQFLRAAGAFSAGVVTVRTAAEKTTLITVGALPGPYWASGEERSM